MGGTKNPIFIDNQDERICWPGVLDEDLRKLFSKVREKLDFVPNVFVTYTVRPEHFRCWFNYFKALMQGESALSMAEREMISAVVSSETQGLYCLVSHGAELRQALATTLGQAQETPQEATSVGSRTKAEILGDRITYRRAGLSERTTAMLDYAVKITSQPIECSEADLERLRQLGFSE